MSETARPFEAGNPAGDSAGQPTAGTLLREARESAGLHIAALAVALKVPVRKLEALEADRFDLLPDAVFTRALSASVCRNLKIDPAPILERLPQTTNSRLAASGATINVPFRGAQDRSGPSLWSQMSRPAVVAGLVLLLAALVLIFMPVAVRKNDQLAVDPVTGVQTEVVPAAAGGAPVSASADSTVVTSTPTTVENAVMVESPVAGAQATPQAAASAPVTGSVISTSPATRATVAASAPVSLPVAALPGSAASAPAGAASAPAPAGNEVVLFKASGESWIEVTDAKRVVVLRRLLTAGESVGASGSLPLSAVVGRADVTQVQVRGKPLDLAAVAKDNVARFEVR